MDEKKINICRLCLNIISDSNHEELKETHQIRIQYILPELSLSMSTNSVFLCTPCIDALQESYEFKTSCVEVETHLENFVSPLKKVDLKEVIAHKMFGGEMKGETTEITEDSKICRLCLGIIESTFFKEFGVIEENILQKCVPEMDLTVTENPVACENCMGYLHGQFNFMMRCLEVDETINNYLTTQGLTNSDKLNLHDVMQFSLQNTRIEQTDDGDDNYSMELEDKHSVLLNDSCSMGESDPSMLNMDTSFDHGRSLSDMELQFRNDSVDARGQPLVWHKCELCSYSTIRKYSLRIHMLIHKKPEEFTMYKCTICPHETNRKSNLLIHLLKHKNPGEVTMHQCKECTYETRLSSGSENIEENKEERKWPIATIVFRSTLPIKKRKSDISEKEKEAHRRTLNAKRCRAYRERKKLKKTLSLATTSDGVLHFEEEHLLKTEFEPVPLALKATRYAEKQQMQFNENDPLASASGTTPELLLKKDERTLVSSSNATTAVQSPLSLSKPEVSMSETEKEAHRRLLNVQRCRAYRQRKKLHKIASLARVPTVDDTELLEKMEDEKEGEQLTVNVKPCEINKSDSLPSTSILKELLCDDKQC